MKHSHGKKLKLFLASLTHRVYTIILFESVSEKSFSISLISLENHIIESSFADENSLIISLREKDNAWVSDHGEKKGNILILSSKSHRIITDF